MPYEIDGAADALRTWPSLTPPSASKIAEKAEDAEDATYGCAVDGGVAEEVQKRLLFPPIRRHRALILWCWGEVSEDGRCQSWK